ncbi:MAG: AAA family ATPase [Thermoproteota archaeon]
MPNTRVRKRFRLIGIVGLPGSGKSTVASALHSYGFPIVVMGDAVRREATRRGIRPSLRNMRNLMLRLRREGGDDVVAELCIPLIRETGSRVVAIDGVRSLAEVRKFKTLGQVILIGVFCPRKLRYRRLRLRRRKDAPKSLKDLELRDTAELDVGLGVTFTLADYMLINNGSIDALKAATGRIVSDIL